MSHRGLPLTQERKLLRRQQAEARQAEYDKLSIEEKLARLPKDGSKKQRAKLLALLDQELSQIRTM